MSNEEIALALYRYITEEEYKPGVFLGNVSSYCALAGLVRLVEVARVDIAAARALLEEDGIAYA